MVWIEKGMKGEGRGRRPKQMIPHRERHNDRPHQSFCAQCKAGGGASIKGDREVRKGVGVRKTEKLALDTRMKVIVFKRSHTGK